MDTNKFNYLEGLEFIHGTQDCYSLLRRVYKEFLDIELTDYARPDDWWLTNKSLYVENFKNEGFKLIEDFDVNDVKLFDVFLIALPDNRIREGVVPPNHCAIYIGDGKIIHHRLGKNSQIKPYQGMLKNFTTHIIRHSEVTIKQPKAQKVDLSKYILPEKRRLIEETLKNES